MSLHEYLKIHRYDEEQILRIERGFYNNKPLCTYIKTKAEYDDILAWLEGDRNHVQ